MYQLNNNKCSILFFILLISSSNVIILNVNAIDLICLEYDGLCDCELSNEYLIFDCSDRGLTEIPDFGHLEPMIKNLDLSNNHIKQFPINLQNFVALETLELSKNSISKISKNSLFGCINLRFLYLNKNNITNWIDINPNELLQPAVNLHTLSVAGNPLTSFTSIDETFVLTSSSLKLLDISDCKIQKVTGTNVLQGLLELEHLILSGNPLRSIVDLKSSTLKTLDLTNCKLTYLQPTIFQHLTTLTYVTLSKNHRLSLIQNSGEFVHSNTLKRIDLSYCNMDNIELDGFPNLVTAILSHNLINHLKREQFRMNLLIENLDLAYNSINKISSTTFRELMALKHLDLSFNMIRRIESETFKFNHMLTSINLSRNYLERLNRFVANSLTHLNVSWCEVLYIDIDAFNDMPELIEVDLANNLLTDFPMTLQSYTLQTLDLSTCRLTTIRNATFRGFPELSRLNLAGNRFTTPFHADFFEDNPYLRDIWLGDNPWRCECNADGFYDFFNYLTEHPARLNDRSHMRCHSPDEIYGLSWESGCAIIWYPNRSAAMGTAEKVWTILMLTILILAGGTCFIISIRKCIAGRKLTQREEERLRNIEESRDILRQNRMMLEQEAQLNAPDPRESRPPCYEDALKLPRLDGSFASLDEAGYKRNRRRLKHLRIRNQSDNNDDANGDDDEDADDDDDEFTDDNNNRDQPITRRNRCRSEEILSMRETVNLRDRQSRHERATQIETETRISIVPAIIELPPRRLTHMRNTLNNNDVTNTNNNELHYHATDILQLNHTTNNTNRNPSMTSSTSHRSETNRITPHRQNNNNKINVRKSTNNSNGDDDNGSMEHITQFESNDHSPYAQRRSKYMSSFKDSQPSAANSSASASASGSKPKDEIHLIEDHYGNRQQLDKLKQKNMGSINSIDSINSSSIINSTGKSISDFSTISSEDIRQLK